MITSLHLGNFKAFAETQTIPIRPLTLIFGANSSGKSTIIHALLFAQNALETMDLDTHRMAIGGDSVDLGGFRQFVHRRETDRRVVWSVEFNVGLLEGRLQELLSPATSVEVTVQIGISEEDRIGEQLIAEGRVHKRSLDDAGVVRDSVEPRVVSYELVADGVPILSMTRRPDNSLQADRLNIDHPVIRRLLEVVVESYTLSLSFSESDYQNLRTQIDELVPTMRARGDILFADSLLEAELYRERKEESIFPVSRGRRHNDLAAPMRMFLPRLLSEIMNRLYASTAGGMKGVRYLGPLRSYPPRHFAFAQYHDPNWLAGGGQAWDVVRTNAAVRAKVNDWLSKRDRLQTPYELVLHPLLESRELSKHLPDHLFEVLKSAFRSFMRDTAEGGGTGDSVSVIAHELHNEGELTDGSDSPLLDTILSQVQDLDADAKAILRRLIRQSSDNLSELVLVDKRSNTAVSHKDVGIGISQVLPVLVAAYANSNAMIAIEQPEIHLHPALQAELGDVFISSALGEQKNRFLLETHSEHIILRILRRIRESTANKDSAMPGITPSDVSLLFVGPGKDGSEVIPIRIDERGRLIDRVPGGFFEEDFAELF